MPPIRTNSSRTFQPKNFVGIGYTLPSTTTADNVESLVEDFLNASISEAEPSSDEVSKHRLQCGLKLAQRKRAHEAMAARTAEAKAKAPKGKVARMWEIAQRNKVHQKEFGGQLKEYKARVQRKDSFVL